jgi:hypothetical protein
MEQQHVFACQGVLGLNLRTLELVARVASQTQVFPHRLPTGCFGDDVIYRQTRSRNGGKGVTIGTLVMEFGHHALAQRSGDARSGHPDFFNSSREGM